VSLGTYDSSVESDPVHSYWFVLRPSRIYILRVKDDDFFWIGETASMDSRGRSKYDCVFERWKEETDQHRRTVGLRRTPVQRSHRSVKRGVGSTATWYVVPLLHVLSSACPSPTPLREMRGGEINTSSEQKTCFSTFTPQHVILVTTYWEIYIGDIHTC